SSRRVMIASRKRRPPLSEARALPRLEKIGHLHVLDAFVVATACHLVGSGIWERFEAIGRVCPSLMVGARISAILTGTSTLCLKKGQEVGELLLGQAGI